MTGARTGMVTVMLCPPNFTRKLATPVVVGVPVTVNDKVPLPKLVVPPVTVAVRPGTPVEAIFIVGYKPPVPPV